MTEDEDRTLPTTNQPLNAEPRPPVKPVLMVVALVVAIAVIFAIITLVRYQT